MKSIHTTPLRILSAVAVSAMLMTTATAWAVSDTPQQIMEQDWARHRQVRLKISLANIAERLEIRSSQQNAWQAYTRAIEDAVGALPKHPDVHPDADAATITRNQADFAAVRARSAARIADATATFQAVLTPEQRKTFDQIVRHFRRLNHRGMHPGHDGEQHHPDGN
jgi:LTXXQ motif family protein